MERTYNVPLRKGYLNTPAHKKAKKAVSVLKEFLAKHMKSKTVLIGKHLNEELWKHGIKNPPHHVKVVVSKDAEGVVKAELHGFKFDHMKKADHDKAAKNEEGKKKSTSAEKAEHKDHGHEVEEVHHHHDEKHEHAQGHTHEHPKAAPKKSAKKSA